MLLMPWFDANIHAPLLGLYGRRDANKEDAAAVMAVAAMTRCVILLVVS